MERRPQSRFDLLRERGGIGAAGDRLQLNGDLRQCLRSQDFHAVLRDLIEQYRKTISLPFEPGEYKRIAVKVIDDRGIESLKIVEVK